MNDCKRKADVDDLDDFMKNVFLSRSAHPTM